MISRTGDNENGRYIQPDLVSEMIIMLDNNCKTLCMLKDRDVSLTQILSQNGLSFFHSSKQTNKTPTLDSDTF